MSARGVVEGRPSACVDPDVDAGTAVVVDEVVDAEAEAEPKIELGAGVVCGGVRDGEPNEKPTLPALGGVDPSLPPEATPNPNDAGVPDDAPPKVNGGGFVGEPKGLPNTLLIGGNFSLSISLSLSSADFALNILPALEEPAVSPNINFVPGAMEKGDCPSAGADEAGLSLS